MRLFNELPHTSISHKRQVSRRLGVTGPASPLRPLKPMGGLVTDVGRVGRGASTRGSGPAGGILSCGEAADMQSLGGVTEDPDAACLNRVPRQGHLCWSRRRTGTGRTSSPLQRTSRAAAEWKQTSGRLEKSACTAGRVDAEGMLGVAVAGRGSGSNLAHLATLRQTPFHVRRWRLLHRNRTRACRTSGMPAVRETTFYRLPARGGRGIPACGRAA